MELETGVSNYLLQNLLQNVLENYKVPDHSRVLVYSNIANFYIAEIHGVIFIDLVIIGVTLWDACIQASIKIRKCEPRQRINFLSLSLSSAHLSPRHSTSITLLTICFFVNLTPLFAIHYKPRWFPSTFLNYIIVRNSHLDACKSFLRNKVPTFRVLVTNIANFLMSVIVMKNWWLFSTP